MPRGGEGVAARAVQGERTRVLNGLLDDVEVLVDRALAAMCVEIPAYAAQAERFYEDVRDQIERHYRAKLAALLEERETTLDDIWFVRRAAMRRARAGFGLEDYINAFRVGQQVFWHAVIEEAGESARGRAAALELATPLMRYCDFASTHAGHAYVEFQQHLVADADRERRDLLEHLLAGRMPASATLLAAARSYGLGPDAVALVATAVPVAGATGDDVPHAASTALARIGPLAKTLVVVRQSEIVAVIALPAGTDAAAVCGRLEEIHVRLRRERIPLAVGVSTPAAGVDELPRAYAEARRVLEGVADEGGVAALPRLTPFDYLALRADDTARRLVDPRLAAFLAEDRERGGVLRATIRAFADADGSLRETGERLQIHPNTVQYRLRRVEERTGRSPRCILDLRDLLVGLALDDRSV
ncbi:MAG TPA: helix-turn-helix domain-containing protein [Solirubrobacteraceae bacterium]